VLGRDYNTQVCSLARSLEVVGERWTLLIVRSVWLGVQRFDDLQGVLGVSRPVLSARLDRLVDEGVLERRQYSKHPRRHEYLLTAKGAELWPALIHLMRWGDTHYPEPEGPPLLIEHRDCGGRPTAELRCDRCDALLTAETVTPKPGPAALRPERAPKRIAPQPTR
jgi:DNA-binding HxlR family transcriptional regulator